MRKLIQIPLLILSTIFFGACGLYFLTGQPFITCFYQAFILLSTVGSQEPDRMTTATMAFVIVWLSVSLGVFAFSAIQFGELLVNADLRAILERRRMEKRIEKLFNHFIICGYGRMGRELCQYLRGRNQPFVVIDQDMDVFTPEMRQEQWHFVEGDATHDDVLIEAGIERARGLTTVLPTDADNLYAVLSARLLSADLQIVARASNDRAAHKMSQAGATRVINPLSSGATRMARFMLSPSIENFVEVAESEGMDWEIADVQIPENSPLIGRQLNQTTLRESGIMLLGVVRADGSKFFPPPGDLSFETSDALFAFGSSVDLARLGNLITPETGTG